MKRIISASLVIFATLPLFFLDPSHASAKEDLPKGVELSGGDNFIIDTVAKPILREAFKNITSASQIPYLNSSPNAKCDKEFIKLNKRLSELEQKLLDIKKHTDNDIKVKIKAISLAKTVFTYFFVDRTFAPKHCVDPFEEKALPRIEALMDEIEAGRKRATASR